MAWLTLKDDDMRNINVLPLDDTIEHLEFEGCECRPRVEEENGWMLIIHNSQDGREAVEHANEIINN
tara:strand:- start:665 stop:865 length:201 start_codon:yes stop_codon:yes gene_type:complete